MGILDLLEIVLERGEAEFDHIKEELLVVRNWLLERLLRQASQ
jgi:hypothetical protein